MNRITATLAVSIFSKRQDRKRDKDRQREREREREREKMFRIMPFGVLYFIYFPNNKSLLLFSPILL